MSERSFELRSLLGTGIRGLRSRLLLTIGSVVLTAVSVGAAVVGPMYQVGAASSYLVTKLQAEPNFQTGMVFHYSPPETEYRWGRPAGHIGPGGTAAALAEARRLANGQLTDSFGPATAALWTDRVFSSRFGGLAAVLSAAGACAHVALVAGRCPSAPGEVLILRHDSSFVDLRIGERFRLPGVETSLRVVGLYSTRAQDEDFWFDLADLASLPPVPTLPSPTPYKPAPLITGRETFDSITLPPAFVKVSRRLVVTPTMSVADLQAAARAIRAIRVEEASDLPIPADLAPEVGNQLVAISHEVQLRRSTASSTVEPAVVSVVLVALVLLLRLLAAAMELRRSELALASLRGFSRRQMWVVGLVEPTLTVLIATPIGLVGGYLCARALARAWLVPGLPMPLGTSSLVAMLTVVAATMAGAALVVRETLGETLAAQIAGVRRPGRSGHWGLLLRLVIIGAAVTVLVATLADSKKSSPDASDLALPILLAVAAGLVTTLTAQALARAWAAWTAARPGIFSFLASRAISRRREGTLVILPVTAALAISIFAAGVFTAAADWRASDAATIVGASVSYPTKLTLGQAVALTHEVDPAGRWLMAVGSQYDGDNQILVMDTPRLPRVGLWPESWTHGMSSADVAHELSTKRPPVTLTGSRISMTVDNRVEGDYPTLSAELWLTDSTGQPSTLVLGAMQPGMSTVAAHLSGCETGCPVKQMSLGGPAGLTQAMHGTAAITSVLVDGKPVPGFLDQSWRVAEPLTNTPVGVTGQPLSRGGRLTIRLAADSASSFAAVTPGDVPRTRPVLMGRTAQPVVDARPDGVLQLRINAYKSLDVRPVGEAESMPVLGPVGMLIDYTMLTRDVTINDPSTDVTILARSDRPAAVSSALADHGINAPDTLSATRAVLDNDAYALALNLYLVVTVTVILLAVAGLGASLAVQMPARRRDSASLRVVGLRRRSIVSAVVAEFVVVLGAAAVAGIAAGSLAQYVVVRTVTLGYSDSQHTPRLLASLNVGTVTALLLLVSVVLLAVAVVVGALTVRGARTASLRENGR